MLEFRISSMIPLIDSSGYQGELAGPRQFVLLCAAVARDTIFESMTSYTPLPEISRRAADENVVVDEPDIGNGETKILFRLREGVERLGGNPSPLGDCDVWVMFDDISSRADHFNHVPAGSNVLYMDGHVSFVRYPSAAPVNKGMALFLGTLLDRHWLTEGM